MTILKNLTRITSIVTITISAAAFTQLLKLTDQQCMSMTAHIDGRIENKDLKPNKLECIIAQNNYTCKGLNSTDQTVDIIELRRVLVTSNIELLQGNMQSQMFLDKDKRKYIYVSSYYNADFATMVSKMCVGVID